MCVLGGKGPLKYLTVYGSCKTAYKKLKPETVTREQ